MTCSFLMLLFCFQATKNPFYLHVGREILDSLERYARTSCGYASLHCVEDKSQEDRMESFFLSETCKYLYLVGNPNSFPCFRLIYLDIFLLLMHDFFLLFWTLIYFYFFKPNATERCNHSHFCIFFCSSSPTCMR